jgi:hypothetical protein
VLVLGLTLLRDRRRFWAVLGALIAVGALMLLPFALGGGLRQVIEQTMLAPFAVSTDKGAVETTLLAQIGARGIDLLRTYRPLGIGLLALGGIGALWGTLRDARRYGWVAVGVAGYTLQVAILDYDFFNDTLYLLAFAQIGFGVLLAMALPARPRRIAALATLALILAGTPNWFVQGNVMIRGNQDPFVVAYWDGAQPTGCHFLRDRNEMRFATTMERPLEERHCTADLRQSAGRIVARARGETP